MITIIHGDDTVSSRKYYLVQKTSDSVSFDGEKLTLTDLVQIIDGGALFSDNKNVFIDDFFSKRKKGVEQEEIINYINKNSKENNIYFWEGKEISKKSISVIPSADIKLFKLPQQLFAFLDSVRPNSQKNLIIFHEALKNSEAELLFFMLIRQFRFLLALHEESPPRHSREGGNPIINKDSNGEIDEVKRLAPWQLTKLKKQSSLFTKDQLIDIYKRLYEIDFSQKTGSLNRTLEQAIDILLLEI